MFLGVSGAMGVVCSKARLAREQIAALMERKLECGRNSSGGSAINRLCR